MDTIAEFFTTAWDLFTGLFGWFDWTSPWTWLVVVFAVMLLGAANR